MSTRTTATVVLAAGITLATIVGAEGEGQVDDSDPLQTGATAIESLECPPGLILHMEAMVGQDPAGGFATPEAALSQELASDFPALSSDASAFVPVGTEATAAQFVFEPDGLRLATAYVEQVGDSWYVRELSACNSELVQVQTSEVAS